MFPQAQLNLGSSIKKIESHQRATFLPQWFIHAPLLNDPPCCNANSNPQTLESSKMNDKRCRILHSLGETKMIRLDP